jgi:hypothetical protein
MDQESNLYTTGYFTDIADFDPGPGIHNLISAGGGDAFISKLNSNGNFLWAGNIGGSGGDGAGVLTVDNSDNIYVCGSAADSTDFDPGSNTYTVAGLPQYFLIKLGQPQLVGIQKNTAGIETELYPNPVGDLLNLQVSDLFEFNGVEVHISNIQGELLYIGEIKQAHTQINVSDLEHGVYFVTVMDSNKRNSTKKIIKE